MTIEKYEVKNRFIGSVQFTAKISVTPDMTPSVKLGLAVRWGVKNGADLRGVYLFGADLRGADLRGVYLFGADLRDADLSGADLRDADLSDADLRDAVLSDADLRDADLSDADLRDADLSGADLSGADLSGADLRDVDLSGADLRDVDLSGADLSDADLNGADLRSFKSCLWMTLTENKTEVPALAESLRNGRVDGSQYEGECACLVGTIANARCVDYNKIHHNASDPSEQWFSMIREGDKPGDDTGGGFAAEMALEWIEEWQALNGQGQR